jgi:hypothetical protein
MDHTERGELEIRFIQRTHTERGELERHFIQRTEFARVIREENYDFNRATNITENLAYRSLGGRRRTSTAMCRSYILPPTTQN